jgi:hypothetical protein
MMDEKNLGCVFGNPTNTPEKNAETVATKLKEYKALKPTAHYIINRDFYMIEAGKAKMGVPGCFTK